ncbi:MAG: SUF system NifU family Fe-S cluster assembly protein [Acidimicrobiia bacterium]|nr:SUF system NifU family Fe-S cluster assembly protein [Acidimicrobiia bacterium]MDH4306481.1 SUF system NifU family Fe-S cluster assembly protein [Acidimicrobiia bacterium]MDH5293111.1 SUF system NifU family Fe-S cluster assembly protein [Acidimicrobiia bacterium]
MSLEELYREVILDHYRNPRNRSALDAPDNRAEGVNPLCGDEVTVEVRFDGDTVKQVSVRGQGCSISQSSASMMSEAIKGKTKSEIDELSHRFKAMLSTEDGDAELDPERPGSVLGDLEALQGVKNYPVRIKCASLPWATLADAIDGS